MLYTELQCIYIAWPSLAQINIAIIQKYYDGVDCKFSTAVAFKLVNSV